VGTKEKGICLVVKFLAGLGWRGAPALWSCLFVGVGADGDGRRDDFLLLYLILS
jgi:hypothetical protein